MNDKVSIQLLVSARGGTIARFDGLNEISKLPSVVTIAQRYFVGQTVPQTGDVKQRICEIVILADKKEAKSIVDKIQSLLIVQDENGENMLVSQFDSNVLKEI